jgi:hypothetical protein
VNTVRVWLAAAHERARPPAATAFPDLSRYPLVEDGYHTENTRQYFSGSTFSTPHCQRCSTNVRDYAHRLWCYGPRPDKGGYWDTSFGPDDAASIKPADPPSPDFTPNPGDFLALPAGHRITLGTEWSAPSTPTECSRVMPAGTAPVRTLPAAGAGRPPRCSC